MATFTRRTILHSTLGLGAVAALPGVTQVVASEGSDTNPIVRTSNGPVRGRLEDSVLAFRGLRYAAPPTGKLRFKPPQPPAPWKDVADAYEFAPAAIQNPGQPDMPDFEKHSEDCLFLNVWTNSLTGKRPVMVWLHGGG